MEIVIAPEYIENELNRVELTLVSILYPDFFCYVIVFETAQIIYETRNILQSWMNAKLLYCL